jgi:hypothetical protein
VTPAQLGAVDKVCVIDTSLNQYKGIWITNWPVEGIEFEGDIIKNSFDDVRIVALLADMLHAKKLNKKLHWKFPGVKVRAVEYTLFDADGLWSIMEKVGLNM